MARFFREDFDRDRTFVVKRPFTFEGRGYIPGQVIDNSLFTVRRLRQLYDMRNLGYHPDLVIAPYRDEVDIVLPEPKPRIERKRAGGIERRRMSA